MMVWKSGGMEQRASMVQRIFESMPGVDGEITNIDVGNLSLILSQLMKKPILEPLMIETSHVVCAKEAF